MSNEQKLREALQEICDMSSPTSPIGVIARKALLPPPPSLFLPRGVYYDDLTDDFYDCITERSMGISFFKAWAGDKHRFPQDANTAKRRLTP